MNLWLLIPVKPLCQAKSRLAGHLSPAERAELSCRLLTNVLSAARSAGVLAGILVVSRDESVLAQVRAAGFRSVSERGRGLNRALRQARREAVTRGADAVLVLPADLPWITAQDVCELYQRGLNGPGVVIAPSHDGGTNALLLRPPDAIEFAFGPHSFRRHRLLAQAAGLPVQVFDSPTLAMDVDWPEDLRMLRSEMPLSALGV
ncbi:MAG: 2-phospho-L-lactate guanylyltransferase [Anaerolineae bacterium]|nr:2-phospho-L-lactate guanylyltransferase [Anaerolineae bacterium]